MKPTNRRKFLHQIFIIGSAIPVAGCTGQNTPTSSDNQSNGETVTTNGEIVTREPEEGGPVDAGNAMEVPFANDFDVTEPFTDDVNRFSTINNSFYGYILTYPEDWKVILTRYKNVLIREPALSDPVIYVESFRRFPGVEERYDWALIKRKESEHLTELRVLDKHETHTNDGERLIVVDLKYNVGQNEVREKAGFTRAKFSYMISLFSNAKRYTDILDQLATDIIKSFKTERKLTVGELTRLVFDTE